MHRMSNATNTSATCDANYCQVFGSKKSHISQVLDVKCDISRQDINLQFLLGMRAWKQMFMCYKGAISCLSKQLPCFLSAQIGAL